MNHNQNWLRRFDEPIELADGYKIETLRDALTWLYENVPTNQYETSDVRSAALALEAAAENGSMLLAIISMIQAIVRYQPGKLNPESPASATRPNLDKVFSRSKPTHRPARRMVKKFPHMIKSIGFGRFLANQRDLWVARLLAPVFAKKDQVPQHHPMINCLLEQLRAAGGSVYWQDGEEPLLLGLNQVIDLGYVVRLTGATHEGVTLTKKGRVAVGIDPAPSTLRKLGKPFALLAHGRPLSLAKLPEQIRTSLILDKMANPIHIALLIFAPYRKVFSRMLRKHVRKQKETRDPTKRGL